MQDFTWKTTASDTKRTLSSHHYIGIEKLRKYLSGISHIENTKADLEKILTSSSIIKATLITQIYLSQTFYLYPMYRKKNNLYHP